MKRKFKSIHLALLAVASSIFFWVADACIDAVILGGGKLSMGLLSPSPNELWNRAMVVLYIAGFTLLMWRLNRQREFVQEKLRSSIEETAAERAKSEAIIAAIGDGICILGPDFEVHYQNHVHESLIGGNHKGEKCFAAFTGADVPCANCPVKATLIDGGIHRLTKKVPGNRQLTHIEIISSPLKDSAGRIIAGIEMVRDISAHMQAKEAVVRKAADLEAANRELESFSYSVSHDLRKPLTIIYAAAQELKNFCSGSEDPQNFYLNSICEASQRMDDLIESLHRLSQISRSHLKTEEVDLSEMVEEILLAMKLIDPSRSFSWDIEPGLTAECDRSLTRILLENLLENARKYSSATPEARISFGRQQTEKGHVFFVRDNGAGFDNAEASELFKPFVRLHNSKNFPGTGIGLATVQRIIERHGGAVWGEGNPGHGACFYFMFQRAALQ